MKLQINLAGSWRDVVRFDAADLDRVKPAADVLAGVATNGAKWRLLPADGDALYLNVFLGTWETLAERRG